MTTRFLIIFGGLASLAACNNAAPGEAPEQPMKPAPEVVSGSTAVGQSFVPSIDPGSMTEAEITQVVPSARRCAFRYTANSPPVVATDGSRGVVKINGDLVAITPSQPTNANAGGVFNADGVRLTIQPLLDKNTGEANLRFEIAKKPGLRVDYRGFFNCAT